MHRRLGEEMRQRCTIMNDETPIGIVAIPSRVKQRPSSRVGVF